MQKHQSDKNMHGDWTDSDSAQPWKPLWELVWCAEPVLHALWGQQICWPWATDPPSEVPSAQWFQVRLQVKHCIRWLSSGAWFQVDTDCWEGQSIWKIPHTTDQSTRETLCSDFIDLEGVAAWSIRKFQGVDQRIFKDKVSSAWSFNPPLVSDTSNDHIKYGRDHSGKGNFEEGHAFIGYQRDTPAAVVFQASKQLNKLGKGLLWKSFTVSDILGDVRPEELRNEDEGSNMWKDAVSWSFILQYIIGESRSEPHINHTNEKITVLMYVCIYVYMCVCVCVAIHSPCAHHACAHTLCNWCGKDRQRC